MNKAIHQIKLRDLNSSEQQCLVSSQLLKLFAVMVLEVLKELEPQ